MKQLTQEQRVLRLWAASGAFEAFQRKIDWGQINLLLSIAGIAAFVGMIVGFFIIAFINGG